MLDGSSKRIEEGAERVFKEIMAENSLDLITHVNMHIQEAQQNQVEHTGREQFLDTS